MGDRNGRPTIAVTAVDGGGKSRATAHGSKTLTWLEIPEWQKDNEYILSGYRRCVSAVLRAHPFLSITGALS